MLCFFNVSNWCDEISFCWMSWLPLCNSWLICIALISLFFWKLHIVVVLLFLFLIVLTFLVWESGTWGVHFTSAFWLFIGSEVIVFLTMFLIIIYNEVDWMVPISDYMELPLLGTFLLIGSSLTATFFHHTVHLSYYQFSLFLTMLLGVLFVVLQLFEFYDCGCDLLMDSFYCTSFCTVGLHFLHVVIGLFLLSLVFFLIPKGLPLFYVHLCVWYWHFVDYIWLVVLFVVYCTSF